MRLPLYALLLGALLASCQPATGVDFANSDAGLILSDPVADDLLPNPHIVHTVSTSPAPMVMTPPPRLFYHQIEVPSQIPSLAFMHEQPRRPPHQPPPHQPAPRDEPPMLLACETDFDCAHYDRGGSCHPEHGYCGVDISGWSLHQRSDSQFAEFEPPTIVPAGVVLVITGHPSQEAFESKWNTPLGQHALFFSTNNTLFIPHEGERFHLTDTDGVDREGTMPVQLGKSWVRSSPNAAWEVGSATPARCRGCDSGSVYITEVTPAPEGESASYGYVELYVGYPFTP